MNRNIMIITVLSLGVVIFGIVLTTFGIIKLSNLTVEPFSSTTLNEELKLMIYTPPAYSLNYRQHYPVLYLLDGDKYFIERKEERRTKWSVQKTIDRLIKENHLPGLIVVGISSTENRTNNYTPSQDSRYQAGGDVEEYAQFIVKELKPYIDTKFRTMAGANNIGIAGVGLGGLAALYIGWEHADLISKIGALTPYLWWDGYTLNEWLLKGLELESSEAKPKIWLAAGAINDPLESSLSEEQLAADIQHLLEGLLQTEQYSKQNAYLFQQATDVDAEDELDSYFESLLTSLFSE